MSIAPSAPHQIVVAGDHPYGYLFDRRQIGRLLQAEWGVPVEDGSLTTCVRRFASKAKPSSYDYITAARVSSSNGHEVILSYGGHSVYLFSTLDDPTEESLRTPSPMLSPNPKHQKADGGSPSAGADDPMSGYVPSTADSHVPSDPLDVQMDESGDREEREEEEKDEDDAETKYSEVPLVLPRRSFKGVSNLRTIKDVNFVGPNDEFVVSGSDEGYFFLWRRENGALHGIYEGDGSVVNAIEAHPTLPLLAVSGIDHEPKLFSPHKGADEWSRLDRAEGIINNNMGSVVVPPILSLLRDIGVIVDATSGGSVDPSQCTHQ